MTDLLPPSPTTLHTNLKHFTPAPSHLYSSFVPSVNVNILSANPSPLNSSAPEKSSPDPHSAFSPLASFSSSPLVHRRDVSLPSAYPPTLPQIRKLDFEALLFSHEETHAELERIVDDLVQCLFTAEVGLTRLLERPSEDRIEEETEDMDNGANVGGAKSIEDKGSLALLAPR